MTLAHPGVWPVVLTPFDEGGGIDYPALEALIAWYEAAGVSGLFAVCQSSEMFFLSLRERAALAAFCKAHAHVPVVASGHVSTDVRDQAEELLAVSRSGVDAVVLLTNRLVPEGADSRAWCDALDRLLAMLPEDMRLGLYECPYPYKWVLGERELAHCAQTGRFDFLKDTCCDIERIRARIALLRGSGLALYNANTATLLASLQAGATGFSGVMVNFHPDLYVWLCEHFREDTPTVRALQAGLTMCAMIEGDGYPVNAKAGLQMEGLPITTYTRARDARVMTAHRLDEVEQLRTLSDAVRTWILPGRQA